MLHLDAGARAPDYFPCRYGTSKAVFRGPKRDLSGPYVAVLGGSASFGKYVAQPYPDLLECALGQPVANLAALNAGPDLYLSDPDTLQLAAGASVAILEVTGAEGLSNPLYTVHGRRNDRFLAARPALRDLYPEVDLADIHFTRHLLLALRRADPRRFGMVLAILKANWLMRMQQLMAQLPDRCALLWLSDAPPQDRAEELEPGLGPLLIDRAMLAVFQSDTVPLVVAPTSVMAEAGAGASTFVPETEALQARCLPDQAAHAEIAGRLAQVVDRLVPQAKRPAYGDPLLRK